jgi:serine/threonine-protein kinase RsbW
VAHIRLTLNTDLGDVALLAVAINGIAAHVGFNDIRASEIELCVVEAVTNAIQHAYHGESGHVVNIAVDTDVDRLRLTICDDGTPMDPDKVHRLIYGQKTVDPGRENISSLAEHGRGLQIIHDLMDDVTYTREQGRNCLSLASYLPGVVRPQ